MQEFAQLTAFCGAEGCENVTHVSALYCVGCREKYLEKALARFPEPPKGKTWIYFMRSGEDGPIKIGQSIDPTERAVYLQTGSAEKLWIETAMLGAPEIEGRLHARFVKHRIRGEWFKPVPDIQALIVWAKKAEKEARRKRLEIAMGSDIFDSK